MKFISEVQEGVFLKILQKNLVTGRRDGIAGKIVLKNCLCLSQFNSGMALLLFIDDDNLKNASLIIRNTRGGEE